LATSWYSVDQHKETGVAFYDVASGKEIEVIRAGTGPIGGAGPTGSTRRKLGLVTAVAMSPDGKFIAAGDAEGNIKVWRRE
jgi:WD40 repeat protein